VRKSKEAQQQKQTFHCRAARGSGVPAAADGISMVTAYFRRSA
jgi:hypothetical protein